MCEIEFSHIGKNNGNPDLVCEKILYCTNRCKNNIRINHEYEGWIEKIVLRITDWHHEACRVMTIVDREGRIFLSHPHTNNGLYIQPNIDYCNTVWGGGDISSKFK